MISTGSSAVQILRSGLLMWPSTECSVVVFPDPVGPTQRMRPYGFSAIALSPRRLRSVSPSRSRGIGSFEASRRMTTSSLPPAVGTVATRSSISRSGSLNRIFPSCGLRRSAMSSWAMIFSRATIARR